MRKLRVAMIGGGGDKSFFGAVHRRALALDATRELVAGVLRRRPADALEAARDLGIAGYPEVPALLAAVRDGSLELDYVTIVTTNEAHYAPAKACLEAGIPVLCEKPLCMTLAEAEDLAAVAAARDVPFVLAHTYTGHPMLMLAREMIRSGAIGEIRKLEAWYTQGWLSAALEKSDVQQARWRTDPARAGISGCGGDIGTHAFVAATWTTGLDLTRVSARLNTFVDGRGLDDDFNVIAELDNGGTAIILATQIAIGHRNDNGLRVYGTEGSLEWCQERAEALRFSRGGPDTVYWLGAGADYFPESVASYLRLPPGHHEDFLEALANLHVSMERLVRRRRGEVGVPDPYPHPGLAVGVAEMKFLAAAVSSSRAGGCWTAL